MPVTPPPDHVTYRREVDGLRAVAVLPVILFHAGFNAFAGGYVGVDVFFVISGYLITTLIDTERMAGTFTLARFYERRVRRILPALFLVLLVTWPFAWAWLIPSAMLEFSQSLASVVMFVSNFFFLKQSGYFATAAELQPLVHTWSLAVEEQYYLLFPPLFLLVARGGRRMVRAAIAGTFVVSLAVAQWGALNPPAATFFLLPTRAWELLLGALLALWMVDRARTDGPARADAPVISQGAGVIGLAMIAAAVALFDRDTPVPGFAALLPTVGAALILRYATATTLVGRVLASRPLVGVGLVSYGAYLWHQPLFALARLRTLEKPAAGEFLVLALAALVLAALSWRFVEQPFRDARRVSRRVLIGSAVGGSLGVAALGVVGHLTQGFAHRFVIPADLATTFARPEGGCFNEARMHDRPDWLCPVGAASGDTTFMLFGDSHARSLQPAFQAAARDLGVRGLYTTASACLPLRGLYMLRPDQRERNCHVLNERVYAYVRDHHVPLVFLVARWTSYTDGDYEGRHLAFIAETPDSRRTRAISRVAFEHALERTLRDYAALGTRVVLVSQVPQQRLDPKQVYYRAYGEDPASVPARLDRLSVTVQAHRQLQEFVSGAFTRARRSGVPFTLLTLDPLYCSGERCRMGDSASSDYHDADHLSEHGALKAAALIARELRAAPRGAVP